MTEDAAFQRKPSGREIVTVRLTNADAAVLDAICERLAVTKSEAIRNAIQAYAGMQSTLGVAAEK